MTATVITEDDFNRLHGGHGWVHIRVPARVGSYFLWKTSRDDINYIAVAGMYYRLDGRTDNDEIREFIKMVVDADAIVDT